MKREEMIEMFRDAIYEGDTLRDFISCVYEAGYSEGYYKGKEEAEENYARLKEQEQETHSSPMSPYERTRNAVYATGNKWAIENFNATH